MSSSVTVLTPDAPTASLSEETMALARRFACQGTARMNIPVA
jgi:hypothetical protein